MSVPVLTVAQMRAWERASWEAGRCERAVIEEVGRLLALRVLALTRRGERVLILAGRGHNGDDARCAQPHLADRGVEALDVTEPRAALPAVQSALERRPALVVDGLFGIGLNRPLDASWTVIIDILNRSGRPVLAVDVPSGLDADTGATFGAAVRARWTVTLGAPKPGLLRPDAHEFTGRLDVEPEIGLIPCPLLQSGSGRARLQPHRFLHDLDPARQEARPAELTVAGPDLGAKVASQEDAGRIEWTLPGDFDGFPPPRAVAGHKGTHGHLLILAGSRGYHGAAVLAAQAAQRARPGLLTLGTAPDVYGPVAAQLRAVMVDDWAGARLKLADCSGMLIGPGLAAPNAAVELRDPLATWWREAALPLVVDASALAWLPTGRVEHPAPRVITPHPGEAARLLGSTVRDVQADRPGTVRALSRRYGGCWVVLKGYQTIVGSGEGPLFINGSGDAALGQGGTGDVLAGYLAGLLAQPGLQSDPLQAIRFAVWQHGAAADGLGRRKPNWTPEELTASLGQRTWPAD